MCGGCEDRGRSVQVFSRTVAPPCAAAPIGGCIAAGRAVLLVKENVPGNERVKAILKNLVPVVTQNQFGDPVGGTTRYALCLYDQSDVLVGTLVVDRAGDTCGTQDCWKALSTTGFRYSDAATTADGVQKIIAKGGDAGRGKVIVKGRNNAANGQTNLPTGLAAALAGHTQATAQVVTDDADCFTVTLDNVRTATGGIFKVVEP